MAGRIQPETLEGVRIGFRNFEGREAKFNAAGDRNFTIFLEPEVAEVLAQRGWTIKHLNQREDDEYPQPILKVKIKYSERSRPPVVVMVTSRGRTTLTEDMLMALDWVDIENVDVMFRAFEGDFNGRPFVTAYLQSIYVTIREDDLERKYADVPELESGKNLGSAQLSITDGQSPFSGELEDIGEYDER